MIPLGHYYRVQDLVAPEDVAAGPLDLPNLFLGVSFRLDHYIRALRINVLNILSILSPSRLRLACFQSTFQNEHREVSYNSLKVSILFTDY